MPVDPSPHLPLVYRVIKQMAILPYEVDEAFDVGLTAVTEAANKYDPTRNVPIANWLGQNIRWSLQSWRRQQRSRAEHEVYIVPSTPEAPVRPGTITEEYLGSITLSRNDLEAYVERQEICSAIRQLPGLERAVIVGALLGYNGLEIAGAMGVTPVAVSRARKRAQAKLREALK
jgi:RNA polymerase sigma factor (sigma-70 family)